MRAAGKCFGILFALLLSGLVKGAAVYAATDTVVVPIAEDQVQRLEMTADSYFFTPNRFTVRKNIAVELVFKSASWAVPHNFVLVAPEAGLTIEKDIGAGATTSVRFTPTHAGEFKFSCTKKLLFFPSHEDLGMAGTMVVKD